jgi:hypothetical protein
LNIFEKYGKKPKNVDLENIGNILKHASEKC